MKTNKRKIRKWYRENEYKMAWVVGIMFTLTILTIFYFNPNGL